MSLPGRTAATAHRVRWVALRPAAALVGRLRYAQKFAVVGLVLLVPLTLVAAAYVNLQRSQIAFSLKERDGVAYQRALVRLAVDVSALRADLAAGGTPDPAVSLAVSLAAVDEVDRRLGAGLGVQDGWTAARAQVLGARRPADAAAALTGLVDLIVSAGDGSNLTLDPDLDSYYLMDVLQFRLPVLLDAAARGVGAAALAGPDPSPTAVDAAVIQLGVSSGVLRSTLATIDRGLGTVAMRTGRGDVRAAALRHRLELGATVRRLDAAFTDAVGRRDLRLLPSGATGPLEVLVRRSGAEVAAELDLLLSDRVDRFTARERAVVIGTTATAGVALYLFAGFYLSVVPPIRRIVGALGVVAAGDLSERVPVETRDELGVVARALNETVALTEQATERLAAQATRDPLTGLPNRVLALQRIDRALGSASGGGDAGDLSAAVLFLDLDRFKLVNDRQGHEAGDVVLREVAARLLEVTGRAGTVARLAGDEFLVVLQRPAGTEPVLRLAEQLVAAMDRPFGTGEPGSTAPARLGVSVGVAFGRVGEPLDAEELVRRADLAMYEAKRGGRGRVRLFDRQALDRQERADAVEQELRCGIETGRLVVHYQPMVESVGLQVVGYEALVRWDHPTRGLLLPGAFIEVAEATGLVVPLGAAVLDAACRQMADWARAAGARPQREVPLGISVNVAPAQLDDPGFVPTLERTLDRHAVPPDRLWLELTERGLLADVDRTRRVLDDIRRMGVRLAIDDFGTGYSSLTYLRRFPVQALKVDRSFVAGLGTSTEDEAIVGMLVRLAGSMGLGVVAEGVETAGQADLLRAMGCTWLQGYRFGRPAPAPALAGGSPPSAPAVAPAAAGAAPSVPAPREEGGVRSPG